MSKQTTKQKLLEHNLAPKKRFGQNFLVNPGTAENIVHCADISEDDTVIEVGVGLGALTVPLARRAQKVIGIEIDSGIVRYHHEENQLPKNVTLIHGDILKTDFSLLEDQVGAKLKIMANLPYSISNPFLFKLVENRQHLDWVTVMVQKEVAERLLAQPSTKQYGIPTILLASCASVKKAMLVKPHEFHPQPKIDSLVIRIDFFTTENNPLNLPLFDDALLRRVVRACFAKRRKTIINNLCATDFFSATEDKKHTRELALKVLNEAQLQPDERAENLTLSEFVSLTNAIAAITRSRKVL